MNHSLYSADRTTYLRVVVVGLIAATLVVCISIATRIAGPNVKESQRVEARIPVVKAGGPIALSDSGMQVVR